MALESGAKRMGITPLMMYRRLKKQDLIHQRLFRHYDLLHTQSLDYVADDIVETLKNWERSDQPEQSRTCSDYSELREKKSDTLFAQQ